MQILKDKTTHLYFLGTQLQKIRCLDVKMNKIKSENLKTDAKVKKIVV